jgi:hypothetical protein
MDKQYSNNRRQVVNKMMVFKTKQKRSLKKIAVRSYLALENDAVTPFTEGSIVPQEE